MAGPKNNSNIEKKPGKKRKRETMEVRNQNSPMETCGYTVVRRSLRVRGIVSFQYYVDFVYETYCTVGQVLVATFLNFVPKVS